MGFFSKIAKGLTRSRESVVKEVKGAFGKGKLTEQVIENIEEKLLAADISMEVAARIMEDVRVQAKGEEIDSRQLLTWMAESTRNLMPETPVWVAKAKPHVILMIGVNGAGKTTTIGKLAHHYKTQGMSVMVAAGDTFRAGAIAQLEKWAQRVEVDIIKHQEGADAASVAFDSYAAAKARGMDILIIDTAGRLHNKGHLMEELRKMVRVLRKHDEALPHECLLVVDGNTGQNAIQQGQGFNAIVKLDGLVVTKLDGTAKGGAIIPLCREFGIPVCWVGVGEDLDDLIRFNREEYVQGLFLKEEVELIPDPTALPEGKTASDYYLGV
ncbi:MAG: signal recognition particle-docking protein FtsY [Fibrobacteres bacterium]|nr:signal recognition particle-docking protein FtsY [Fibrobacterota bacterium]